MACYGGTCSRACPLYATHHPEFIQCAQCSKMVLLWAIEDGRCPRCGGMVIGDGAEEEKALEGSDDEDRS